MLHGTSCLHSNIEGSVTVVSLQLAWWPGMAVEDASWSDSAQCGLARPHHSSLSALVHGGLATEGRSTLRHSSLLSLSAILSSASLRPSAPPAFQSRVGHSSFYASPVLACQSMHLSIEHNVITASAKALQRRSYRKVLNSLACEFVGAVRPASVYWGQEALNNHPTSYD